MAESKEQPKGPDLKSGIDVKDLKENSPLVGHVDGEAVMLVRQGDNIFATGATCTHYSGPLPEGLIVEETVRCPWHHARFCLRTGEALGAPALNPIPSFTVHREGQKVRVGEKKELNFQVRLAKEPKSVVIVGGGAAGAACVDMLRSKGYKGSVTLVANEEPGPVDRPNLSKDYLAGAAPEEWIPLRTPDHYQSIDVEMILGDAAASIDPTGHKVSLRSGRSLLYSALLLATGAEPRELSIEGANLPHVHYLRTLADSRDIIAAATQAERCVVIGSSFIGLEVAASLRQRGLEVTVVGRDSVPLEKVLGKELGQWVQGLHEQKGVRFVLGKEPRAIRADRVELNDGQSVPAELAVVGVGVTPRTGLAEDCGLKVDNGIVVDENLRTSTPDVYAAGDVARYRDSISGESARIEHWVLAERHGQAVARAMLGLSDAFGDVPFFWSQHYDSVISYVGHAPSWDDVEVRGDLKAADACAIYRKDGRVLALATIGRDRLSLEAEAALERNDQAGLKRLLESA